MIDQVEFLWNWSFSVVLLLIDFSQSLSKAIAMALSSSSPTPASSPTLLPWKRLAESHLLAQKRSKDRTSRAEGDALLGSPLSSDEKKGLMFNFKGFQEGNSCSEGYPHQVSLAARQDCAVKGVATEPEEVFCNGGGLEARVVAPRKLRKRPASIVVPESCMGAGFGEVQVKDLAEKELEFEGNGYWVASRRGSRQVMEDGYGVMTNIHGDSKQAYFGVFDGHGGRPAVDFVSEKLGKNIMTALDELDKEEGHPELAIRKGYLTTDKEFLSQDVSSGACVATVLLKDGELHVANVGDCRVVISREGVASALTSDHNAGREDERMRIESLGGYVGCNNGIWRVQNSLAVSRAIGDAHMKEWVIAEPETEKLRLTSDCEFLIMASDGLWDKVTNQEAVDVVTKHKSSIKSCKSLVDLSLSRGCRDDITVLVVDLQRFMKLR